MNVAQHFRSGQLTVIVFVDVLQQVRWGRDRHLVILLHGSDVGTTAERGPVSPTSWSSICMIHL